MFSTARFSFALAATALATTLGVAPSAVAAPIPGAVADAADLVGGPALLSNGKIAWVEATESRWRLRMLYGSDTPGTKPTTLASGRLVHEEDDDSGDVTTQSIGEVRIGDGGAIIEFKERSGSSKYDQYVDRSTVESYPLSVSLHGGPSTLADCSSHVDEFNGPDQSAQPSPSATIHTDGFITTVALCGKTQVWDANGSQPIATIPAAHAYVQAVGGDFIAAYAFDSATKEPYYGVWNWRTDTELYRLAGVPIKDHISRFALEPNGVAAVVTHEGLIPTGCRGQLTRHSPDAPGGTLLADDVCGTDPAASSAEVAVETEPVPGAGRRLTIIRADGSRKTEAWLGAAKAQPGPFGLSHGLVAYAVQGCDSWTIARGNGDATPRGLACPNLDLRRARRTGRTLSVRVNLASGASSPITISYKAGGHVFRTAVTPAGGHLSAQLKLPRWALGRSGSTTVTYPADATFRRQALAGY